MLALNDVQLELGVLGLERGGHDAVFGFGSIVHLKFEGRVIHAIDGAAQLHVGGHRGKVFAVWIDKGEPPVLARVVLQVVNIGQVQLELADELRLEEALRLELDQNLGRLKLCYRLVQKLDKDVAIHGYHCRVCHIHELFRVLFLALHLDFNHDIHSLLSGDI